MCALSLALSLRGLLHEFLVPVSVMQPEEPTGQCLLLAPSQAVSQWKLPAGHIHLNSLPNIPPGNSEAGSEAWHLPVEGTDSV